MDFVEFKKIPRLTREMTISEKIDGSNGQIFIQGYSDLDVYDCQFITKYALNLPKDFNEGTYTFLRKKPYIFAGSKNRWLDTSSKGDNFGFAKWVQENSEELLKLGEGRHFGEWFGKGIQRGYGLNEKRFALFNVSKWGKNLFCHNCGNTGILRTLCNEVGEPLNCPECKDNKRKECPSCCEVVPTLYQGMFDTQKIEEVLIDLKNHGSYVVPFMNPEGIIVYHVASGTMFKKTLENDEKPKGV